MQRPFIASPGEPLDVFHCQVPYTILGITPLLAMPTPSSVTAKRFFRPSAPLQQHPERGRRLVEEEEMEDHGSSSSVVRRALQLHAEGDENGDLAVGPSASPAHVTTTSTTAGLTAPRHALLSDEFRTLQKQQRRQAREQRRVFLLAQQQQQQRQPSQSRRHSSSSSATAPSSTSRQDVLQQQQQLLTLHEHTLISILTYDDPIALGMSVDDHATERAVRPLCWSGAPPTHRAQLWRLLLDYAPVQRSRRAVELRRKRAEYDSYCTHYYPKTVPVVVDVTTTMMMDHRAAHHDSNKNMMSTTSAGPLAAVPQQQQQQQQQRTDCTPQEKAILLQLSLDLPRHHLAFFHLPRLVSRLERCLFLWSIRHPAVGYVQGLDDIMVPFFFVFLSEALLEATKATSSTTTTGLKDDDITGRTTTAAGSSGSAVAVMSAEVRSLLERKWHSVPFAEQTDKAHLERSLSVLTDRALDAVEADAYWSGGRFLSFLQDNYVHGQPGVHWMLQCLEQLVAQVDPVLYSHLQDEGVLLSQACFQWVHCLLVRELPPRLTLCLWDTYMSIGSSFVEFHVCVCAALITVDLRSQLLRAPMDVILGVLKHPKSEVQMAALTREWLQGIVAEAYVLFTNERVRKRPPQ